MSLQRLKIVSDYLNKNYDNYSIIDLGCRTKDLKALLNGYSKYIGTDLVAGDGIIPCDLEKPLPFKNDEYDIVCILDVLEHIDNVHHAVKELGRVAKNVVVISLPNIAHWTFRLRFLFRGSISGKYTFNPNPGIDRHRWVTNYDESKEFIKKNFPQHKINIINIIPQRGRTRIISSPLESLLAKFFPNTFIYGIVAIIDIT